MSIRMRPGGGNTSCLHVTWLQDRLKEGSLLASGPFSDATVRSALLIMDAPDRTSLGTLIANDPLAAEGLIKNMTVRERDPIFGAFNEHSSIPCPVQGR